LFNNSHKKQALELVHSSLDGLDGSGHTPDLAAKGGKEAISLWFRVWMVVVSKAGTARTWKNVFVCMATETLPKGQITE